MTDESETGAPVEVVGTDAPSEAPVPKKQRAPRRSKAEMEAAATAKSLKIGRKRSAQGPAAPLSSETTVAGGPKKAVVEGPKTAKPPRQVPTPTEPVTVQDEMAEFLQLEEDNKRLRQALAEKLRAENADLRKRLGV